MPIATDNSFDRALNASRDATRRRSFSRGGSGMPKVIMVPVCLEDLYRSDGTVNYLVDLKDIAELRELGPAIAKIRAIWVAEGATANFKGRVTMAWSALGRTWSTPVEIFAPLTGPQTGTIGAWYSDDANFGPLLRFAIEVCNASGAAQESARLSVMLQVELKS
ncbi:MAG: hypothetical protein FJ102_20590 [Deltaproteobacteria bacterium]|nr:hypothetical protein [Deltaproteobacteria bacterium]